MCKISFWPTSVLYRYRSNVCSTSILLTHSCINLFYAFTIGNMSASKTAVTHQLSKRVIEPSHADTHTRAHFIPCCILYFYCCEPVEVNRNIDITNIPDTWLIHCFKLVAISYGALSILSCVGRSIFDFYFLLDKRSIWSDLSGLLL